MIHSHSDHCQLNKLYNNSEMALIYTEPELVIALEKKVIFVNPNDLQIFKDVELPADLTKCGLKATATNAEEKEEHEQQQQQQKKTPPQEVPTIQNVALSSDRQLLAITTAGQKAVLLYQCRPVHAKLVAVRPLARASSALTFSGDCKLLLVTDKTGDCYQYDCVDIQAPPKLLLGHLSIVYAVLLTTDTKFVITCDRDDKIRVTNYPDTHDIHGYCLGHREFVAGMALLPEDGLVSISGDKTLRLWDYSSGKELAKMELPAPGIRLALRQRDDGKKFEAAVLLYQPDECIGLYELQKNSDGSWSITETAVLSVPDVTVQNVCFAEERLYVTGVADNRFTIRVVDGSNSPPAPDNWLTMVEEQFNTQPWKPEDIDGWFKKKYDNVTEYLERKKRRIEEKQK